METTKKSIFVAKRTIAQKKPFPPSSLNNCLEVEQFVLVPLSVYNSTNNPTNVTKQEPPNYKPDKAPTCHKGTLEREINQQLSKKASPLINKNSTHQAIKLQHFDSGWNKDWCAVEGLCSAL